MSKMTASAIKKLASATKACLDAKNDKVRWAEASDYQSRSYWIVYKQYVITKLTFTDVTTEAKFEKTLDESRNTFIQDQPTIDQLETYTKQAATKSMDGLVADGRLLRVALRFYEAIGANVEFVGYTDYVLRLHGKADGVEIDSVVATIANP